jgi:DNA-binding GntR family transcriptional regulator
VQPSAKRKLTLVDNDALRGRSRGEFVYDAICQAISEGGFKSGERIREEEIAARYGVSRTPVREALQRLQERGLLTIGAGRGLVVAELTKHQVLELYVMREILEGAAARFAALNALPDEIDNLNRIQQEYLASFNKKPSRLVPLNRRFHQAIFEAAHNQYLTESLNGLHDSIALLHNSTFRVPSRPDRSDEEHRAIITAIERRDPDGAEEAARAHIRSSKKTRFELSED